MRILFCSEGFILDGVASYHLHMAVAFKKMGHEVGILGRWLGFNGYQSRFRENGVQVLSYVSPFVTSSAALGLARDFAPDVLISDSRRAFPLALQIHERTGTPIITIFMDPPQNKEKKGRRLKEIESFSAAWVSPERSLCEKMSALNPSVPVRQIRRAVVEDCMILKPVLPRDPFSILCMGRLSKYKTPGLLAVFEDAPLLRKKIPSVRITAVGGGWRRSLFAKTALKANISAGERYVRTVGYQPDPAPWFAESNVVCSGSTCVIESILCNRPVIAVSAYWFGLVTPANLDDAIACYYGERGGHFPAWQEPKRVTESLLNLYEDWNVEQLTADMKVMRERFLPLFDPATAVREWEELFNSVL